MKRVFLLTDSSFCPTQNGTALRALQKIRGAQSALASLLHIDSGLIDGFGESLSFLRSLSVFRLAFAVVRAAACERREQ